MSVPGADEAEARRAILLAGIAQAVRGTLRPRADTVSALITAILPNRNGTPVVAVRVGGAVRRAAYPLPYAPQIGRIVFVEPVVPGSGEIVVVASNFQVVPRAGHWGTTSAAETWGSGSGTWGGPG